MKRAALALLLVCLGPTTIATLAQAPAKALPTIVFVGDSVGWTTAYQAHPNWINKSDNAGINGYVQYETSWYVLAKFQADVISLHPAIVHIMVGEGDVAQTTNAGKPYLLDNYIPSVISMIQEARAANIRVILGTSQEVPYGYGFFGPSTMQINAWLTAYGAANGITVVNYHDLLCACVGSTAPNVVGDQFDLMVDAQGLTTPAGYAAEAALAEIAIETQNLTVKSGYLSNPGSVNSVLQQGQVAFTAVGVYSDGQSRPMMNTNFAGATGVWASSNPTVLYVDQQGNATALTAGKARISFRSFSGRYFSPWDVTVIGYCGQYPCGTQNGN